MAIILILMIFFYLFQNPLTWILIGIGVLGIKWKVISSRKRKILTGALILFSYLFATPFLVRHFIAALEDQHPPIDITRLDNGRCYNIIVLGAGMGFDDRLPPTGLLSETSTVRLVEALRVYRQLKCARIITSGISSAGFPSLGEIGSQAAIALGVPKEDVAFLSSPTNTEGEAKEYSKAFGIENPVIIATTATHMPRAIYHFRKMGIKEVIGAPTDFKCKRQSPPKFPKSLIPRIRYFQEVEGAIHEFVGLTYAKMKS